MYLLWFDTSCFSRVDNKDPNLVFINNSNKVVALSTLIPQTTAHKFDTLFTHWEFLRNTACSKIVGLGGRKSQAPLGVRICFPLFWRILFLLDPSPIMMCKVCIKLKTFQRSQINFQKNWKKSLLFNFIFRSFFFERNASVKQGFFTNRHHFCLRCV